MIRGLTWDHPRGYKALATAAARASELALSWHRQPLEGFESAPIDDLCARHDIVVIDHPHIGEAVAKNAIWSLEEVFDPNFLGRLAEQTIGPCLDSYRWADLHWALPLDAAAQVMACRADLLGEPLPGTWADIVGLSRRSGRVALSLAGPHAMLSLFSIAAGIANPAPGDDAAAFLAGDAGRQAYDILAELHAYDPGTVRDLNPIGILDAMSHGDAIVLCPLIFGYVNYAAPQHGKAVTFADAPRLNPGGRPGGTLGGTGIALSRRFAPTAALKDHLAWLMSATAQATFIPDHDGQPSSRAAWHDPAVNARWNGFYRNTAETLERAFVRPRHHGSVGFQERASALLRNALAKRAAPGPTIARLISMLEESRVAAKEHT